MKKTILLSTFVFLSFTTVPGQQPPRVSVPTVADTWIKVAPANSGFTVLMPAKPSEQANAVEGRPELKNYLLTLDTKLAGYVISYVEFPDDITDPDAIKVMLDSGRDGGVAGGAGKLLGEKEIKLGEYLGREWDLEISGGFLATARAYWVRRRLYQTVFVVAPNESDTPELKQRRKEAATKFLDSFTLSVDSGAK